jgi:ABC-2 type transport system permease protein
MRIRAITWRIIMQLFHDKRTTGLILVAPIVVLTLTYFILNTGSTTYTIGVTSAPEAFVQALENTDNVEVVTLNQEDHAQDVALYLDGSNVTHAQKIQAIVKAATYTVSKDKMQQAFQGKGTTFADADIQTNYVYGKDDLSMFDEFGASLIGVTVFFFSFIIAGINFLNERSTGTLEKLLSTPVRRSEIIVGYVLGFSILALFQTAIISAYTVYVLQLDVQGNIGYVFLINLLTAVVALTLGILLSTLANSEFQMVQFIPIVIIPQIFLCGLFDLSSMWNAISYVIPLHYTSKALTEVILKGNGWNAIWLDVIILIAFSVVTILCNIRYLAKQRSI